MRPKRKDDTLDAAPPGMLGLQTALPVVLGALGAPHGNGAGHDRVSHDGGSHHGAPGMSSRAVLGLLSWRPARIAGLARDQGGDQGGPIEAGAPANICVIDPAATWEVDPVAARQPEPQHAVGRSRS